MVENGRCVSFDYTLTIDGKVADSSKGRDPLQYTHGKGEIISGLSKQLEGMTAGDEKTVTVAPEDAYGLVDPNAFKEIERSCLPAHLTPQAGMLLQMKTSDGHAFPVKIAEVRKDGIVIDFNHPLAGKTLNFVIKVISVE